MNRSAPLRMLAGLLVGLVGVAGTCYYGYVLDPHYPVVEWLVWRLAPLWGYTLLFNLACVLAGATIVRWVVGIRRLPAAEWLLQSMCVGLVLFVFGQYLAGALCALTPWFAIALPGALLALGVPGARATWCIVRDWWNDRPRMPFGRHLSVQAAVAFGTVCLAFVYLEALHPSAINFDAAWYHLPIAQDYARIGCIVPFPAEGHRAFPHLTSIVHTWALSVPGLERPALRWMLALHLEFGIVVWRIVGIVAVAQWMLAREHTPGLWAVFFLFPAIFIYDQNIGGSADHFLGFSAVPIFLALARMLPTLDLRQGALLAVALGCHVLTKYQAVYLVGTVGALLAGRWLYIGVLLARKRAGISWRRWLAAPLVVGALSGGVAGPHLVKNVVFYGNPVYPFAQSVFPTTHPKEQPGYYEYDRSKRGGAFRPRHEGLRRQLWAIQTILEQPFETHNRSLTGNRPYMGALFSLLLPCVLLVRGRRRLMLGIGVYFIAAMIWANTSVNDRYLLSFSGISMGVTAALLVRAWQLGWLARMGLVSVVAIQLFWGADAMLEYGGKRLRAAIKLDSAGYSGRFDDARFDQHRTEQRITDATPPDARILARNYKALLGLDRYVLSDVPVTQWAIDYSHCRNPREFWDQLRGLGVTHLLWPVGQRRPHIWNNTILFDAVAAEAGRRERIGSVALVELPTQPPPDSVPYLVLTVGIREYPDGLYPVEALDVDYRYPERFSPRPRPRTKLTRRNAARLLREADVVAGRASRLSEAKAELQKRFREFESFGTYGVYFRRQR